MTDVHSFDMRLKELGEKATDRLLMAEVFDEHAFSELYAYCLELAEKLVDEYVVPKQFLAVLIGTSQAIRSRAEYLGPQEQRVALLRNHLHPPRLLSALIEPRAPLVVLSRSTGAKV